MFDENVIPHNKAFKKKNFFLCCIAKFAVLRMIRLLFVLYYHSSENGEHPEICSKKGSFSPFVFDPWTVLLEKII